MAFIPRDEHNVSAALRTAGAMKDRRAPRGGSRNLQAEWLAEWDEEQAEEAEETEA